ncbi:MAG: nucleoside-diphosphate kinase [Candidatus Gracilibacteria bacterium]|nr:nucleoside-diphosphate kinase [Candidatus Gracilibacteria bacterium]
MRQKSLIILKPDTVQRGLVGEITGRFEKKGLKLVANKMAMLKPETLREHYAHIADKPFFPGIEKFMSGSPVILQVWEGFEAIDTIRTVCGVTNSRTAAPGTIRGDLSMSYGSNVIHASDSPEAAEVEVKRFFSEEEVFEYNKVIEQYSYSEDER